MMNSVHAPSQSDAVKNSVKVLSTRRPLQSRSVNLSSSSPSPAKKVSTSKPKLAGIKSRLDSQSKLTVLSENNAEWPSLSKEAPTPSLESSDNSISRPIFRRRADLEDEEDMFVLKRANPVYDSDDDDEVFSPAKRQRTGEPTVLSWCDQIDEDETDGFAFSSSSLLLR
eukprot:CAMPEP_0117032272 /NCGR_PEP_ID=MMETSP0472-20121206/23138_1 /TAXON_ID=693140 ORGANISM="Tiarina fusus, Strain LIS" /NCGR_SAMPLE_ID=MMETSP0472 /ASSEMBLY_ACC=CAM_ASM_000603 /LENGTH=168 /DNA_ID=CAMNT_0004740847 /DNA_START=116 /DNA_END=622 /DNA_ORIENTATION=+